MNMIGTDLQRLDHKSMTPCDLVEDLLHPHLKIAPQNPLAILGRPHQMILRVTDRVACSAQHHAARIDYPLLPAAGKTYHPRLQNGVFKL
jgi:hypothetical protein